MKNQTLLEASNLDNLSSRCRRWLATAEPNQAQPVLLRPRATKAGPSTAHGPTDLLDALQDAGQALGTGSNLSSGLKQRLQRSTVSLRAAVPEATSLWLAEALAAELSAEQIARLSQRSDLRQIDLQPTVVPARRSTDIEGDQEPASTLELELPKDQDHPPPKVALIDAVGERDDRKAPPLGSGQRWLHALETLIPEARWIPIDVFRAGDQAAGDDSTPPLAATYSQVVDGLQVALEREADVVLLDLGEAALDPIWHLPWLNCTLQGTTVVVAGCERRSAKNSWPIHLPLAGCYAEGPLRTDVLASGAALGPGNLVGSLAAAARTAAAITLIQSVAPKLRRRPDALVGLLFAGPQRGLSPDGDVELDPGEALKMIFSAA